MRTILIVAGAAWFILAWIAVLSLARAARRRTPSLPPTAWPFDRSDPFSSPEDEPPMPAEHIAERF
jgi:hypothetical protein